MTAPDHDLDALFKRLHLANARRVWRDLVQRAERDAWWARALATPASREMTAETAATISSILMPSLTATNLHHGRQAASGRPTAGRIRRA